MKVNGITYHLVDYCNSLVNKLENELYELRMEQSIASDERADSIEDDIDKIDSAIRKNNHKTMRAMLDKYRTMLNLYN